MALTQLAQHPSKPNRSDSARPQSPRPTLCNCSLTALSNSPTSAGLYPHQVPQLTGKPGMPSGTGSTGPLLSPRLHYYTQAACPRRSPQAARGQPGRPPLAHHKPSPGPTGKGSPRRLGEVAPGAGGGRPRSPPHPTLRARVRPSSPPSPHRGVVPSPTPHPPPLTQRLQRPRQHRRGTGGHGAAHAPRPNFRHARLAARIGSRTRQGQRLRPYWLPGREHALFFPGGGRAEPARPRCGPRREGVGCFVLFEINRFF